MIITVQVTQTETFKYYKPGLATEPIAPPP